MRGTRGGLQRSGRALFDNSYRHLARRGERCLLLRPGHHIFPSPVQNCATNSNVDPHPSEADRLTILQHDASHGQTTGALTGKTRVHVLQSVRCSLWTGDCRSCERVRHGAQRLFHARAARGEPGAAPSGAASPSLRIGGAGVGGARRRWL
ncbi:hypothetical protein T492DRAFT_977751 [Pavlovales sp. CCMP2436]|nr:hypothetical protein T492DRAFT_977751 [Pavlovales sp. CCMP2436]